jgi:hypothetical protein
VSNHLCWVLVTGRRPVFCCLLVRLAAVALVVALTSGTGAAQAVAEAGSTKGAGGLRYSFGVEYWVRSVWRGNFDLDRTKDDGLLFGWQRVKPFFSVRNTWLELTAQGQDARSYGVPLTNPNGALTAPSSTSQLDFIKAYAKAGPWNGVTFKIGREQADGNSLGISKKVSSSTNYGTVLRSFDVASVKWERASTALLTFISSPVENKPSQLNTRVPGEVFWGLQADKKRAKNLHRAYFVGRSISRDVLASETGVRGDGMVYAIGFQETGPLVVPGVVWELEAIGEWGHRSTDELRAGAVFINGTHTFAPDQSVSAGYFQSSGDAVRGDGTTHLFDPFYSSGFNNYGYLGLSAGRNIRDLRFGGTSKIRGPATFVWAYHHQNLSSQNDAWYGIFTPNIVRSGAESAHLGEALETTLLLRFPFAKRATFAVQYMRFFPGAYLTTTGAHSSPQQFSVDINGQF